MMLWKLLTVPQKNWEPMVVCLKHEGAIGSRIRELGVPVFALGFRSNVPNPLKMLPFIRLVRQWRPHLLHGWMYHGNLAASIATIFAPDKAPVLWNVLQSLYDIRSERALTALTIRLGAWRSRHVAAILYDSRVSADQHRAFGYDSACGMVIPGGFDCQAFRPNSEARRQVRRELAVDPDAVLIGLVARYHPVKNHAGFLRAAGLVARAHPRTRFLLVGRGISVDQPEIARLLEEYRLHENVLLLGERSDIPRLTAALDIACSASWGEGFSNSIGEAMACGVPCVVTDVGDSAFAIGSTGIAVPPGDPEAFSRALCQMIEGGAEYRRRLGAAARERVENEFSLSAVAHQYHLLWQAVFEGRFRGNERAMGKSA